jgi:hypothetical protein
MELTQADRDNLLDALQEWNDAVGPKELDSNEVGLDADRFSDLVERLKKTESGTPVVPWFKIN